MPGAPTLTMLVNNFLRALYLSPFLSFYHFLFLSFLILSVVSSFHHLLLCYSFFSLSITFSSVFSNVILCFSFFHLLLCYSFLISFYHFLCLSFLILSFVSSFHYLLSCYSFVIYHSITFSFCLSFFVSFVSSFHHLFLCYSLFLSFYHFLFLFLLSDLRCDVARWSHYDDGSLVFWRTPNHRWTGSQIWPDDARRPDACANRRNDVTSTHKSYILPNSKAQIN